MSESQIGSNLNDEELSIEIAKLAEDLFAEDVKVLNIKKISTVADYIILMTGNSSTQVKSLSSKIDKEVRSERSRIGMEGRNDNADWVLLDYGTVVVHIFDSTARLYYNLDELWKGNLVVWEEIKKGNVVKKS
ncbi:MAG: ribosome silencing factor [Planctomycetota bacterium]|nr:MAG: ribosome silencing factor [Planctomycetota bacterium]